MVQRSLVHLRLLSWEMLPPPPPHIHPFTPTKQSNARIPESRDSVLQPAFQESFDPMTQSP